MARSVAANGNHEDSGCVRMDFGNRADDSHLRDLLSSLGWIIIVNCGHIESGGAQSTDDHLGMPTGANDRHAGLAVHGWIEEDGGAGSPAVDWHPVNAGMVAWPSALIPSRRKTWITVRARIFRSSQRV